MEQHKKQEPTFYWVWNRSDKFSPGIEFQLGRAIEFDCYRVDKSDLAELVKLPLSELQEKRKEGAAAEKAIYEEIKAAAQKWEEQAARTMLLDRAIEHARTPEVKHTANEWKRKKDGTWEISNLVYMMRYRITQEKEGNHKGQWLVTWGIVLNRPARPSTERYNYDDGFTIVETKKKYYNAEADAQNYIQGRFDVYAHLFKELSPPVPYQYRRHFKINGVLLPSYTIAPPEREPQEVAAELLELLNDDDIAPPSPVEPEQAPAKDPTKAEQEQMPTKTPPSKETLKKGTASKAPAKPARAAAKKPTRKRPSAPER